MTTQDSEIFLTMQCESSHSIPVSHHRKIRPMDALESQTFIANLIAAVDADDRITDAGLSLKAGVNRRMVTDMRDGKVKSPKLSTVCALAQALNRDPSEMLGWGPRRRIRSDLAARLEQYSEDDQERFLKALDLMFPENQ